MTDFEMTGIVEEDSKRFIAEAEKYIPKILRFSDNSYPFRDADNNDIGILEDGVVRGELCEGERIGCVPLVEVARLEGDEHGIRLYDGKGKQRLVLSWGEGHPLTYRDVRYLVEHGTFEEWGKTKLAAVSVSKSGVKTCTVNLPALNSLCVELLRYDKDNATFLAYDEDRRYWADVGDFATFVRSLFHQGVFNLNDNVFKNDTIANAMTCVMNKNTIPSTSNAIAFKDGIWAIDGDTGKLIPHDKDTFVKYAHPFPRYHTPQHEYPEEEKNRLLEYLYIIHNADIHGEFKGDIVSVRRWFGYCLYYTGIAERGFYLSWGGLNGHTGKTTEVGLLWELIGREFCVTKTIADMKSNFGRAGIRNKLLVDFNEISANDDMRGIESVLKTMTGGGRITSDIKYGQSIEFFNHAKPMANTNFPPKIHFDGGLRDRLLVMKMTHQMSPTEFKPYEDMLNKILSPKSDRDGNPIYDDLTLTQISRVYEWAWIGYCEWLNDGKDFAKSSLMIKGSLMMEVCGNPLTEYLTDMGVDVSIPDVVCEYLCDSPIKTLLEEYRRYSPNAKLGEFKMIVMTQYGEYLEEELEHKRDGYHFERKAKKETKPSHELVKNSIQKLMVAVKEYVVRERLQTGDYLTMSLSDEQRKVLVEWNVIDDAGRLME